MRNVKTITESEALEIFSNEEADNLPFRVLNQAGQAAVATWVKMTSSEPDRHNLDAWYSDAESAANNATIRESIIIEMRGMHTASGHPETLNITADAFDWQVQA